MGTTTAFCSSLQLPTRNAEGLLRAGEGRPTFCSGSTKISLRILAQKGIATDKAPTLNTPPAQQTATRDLYPSVLSPPLRSSTTRNAYRGDKKLPSLGITAIQGLPIVLLHGIMEILQQDPPTWTSSVASNALFLVIGFPALRVGLTLPAMASAFLLGTLTWKAFGPQAFLLLVFYFVLGTGVTKVKIKQKEKEGIAEKRSGKRGPSSVWGSGAAGMVCAVAAIMGLGGSDLSYLWRLGFAASFATKLSDTVSSEIGKAYGTTTYLITTLRVVPRGTDGAVSLEGTLAGLSASLLFCALAYNLDQVTARDALICVIVSQVANLFESYAGATLQDRKGFEWLNNDVVNVANISLGAALAIAASYACDVLW